PEGRSCPRAEPQVHSARAARCDRRAPGSECAANLPRCLREMSRWRLNGVTVMPHGLTTVTGKRAGCREDSNDAAHRDRRADPAGDLQQEFLPAMQRLAARSRLVRTSQRALRAPRLVV